MKTHHPLSDPPPGPACAAFEPLLTRSLLDPEAAEELRAHATGCATCRARLAVYDRLDNALRRAVGQFSRSPLRTEDIVQSLETPDGAAPAAPTETRSLPTFPAPTAAPAPPRRRSGRPRRVISWVATIAAVLVIALVTTALVASHHPAGPTARKPAATQAPALPASVYGTEGALASETNGVIFALNAADGTLRWQYPTPQAMSFKLLVNQGVLYFGETDGSVYALDARTGKRLWSIKLPGSPAPERIAEGIVYVNTLEFTGVNQPGRVALYALDSRNGAQVWHFDNGGIEALVDGVAYISSGTTQSTGTIHALNASDGTERWHFQGQGTLSVQEVVDGQVYISGNQFVGSDLLPSDILYAVDASTGALDWSFPKQPSGGSQLVGIEHGQLYVLSNIGSSAPEGPPTTLYALNAGDGSLRWQIAVIEGVVLGSSVIYAPTNTGSVLGYRASDGVFLWRTDQLPGSGQYMPTMSGIEAQGAAYLWAEGGGLYALDSSTGKLLWSGGQGRQIGGFANGLLITYTYLSQVPGTSDAIYGLNPSTGAVRWTYSPTQELARVAIP